MPRISTAAHSSQSARPGPGPGLLLSVLSGMLERPAGGGELREASHGPTGLDLDQDVLEVVLGVQTEQQAVVDERVGDRETLAATDRACEQKVAPAHGKRPDSAFHAPVVDLETPVLEASTQENLLAQCVGGRRLQRRLG